MPFQPGVSGNPAGSSKERRFLAALDRAMAADDGKLLRRSAEKLLEQAAAGEPWAISMLADRLDGKPEQAVAIRAEGWTEALQRIAQTRVIEHAAPQLTHTDYPQDQQVVDVVEVSADKESAGPGGS